MPHDLEATEWRAAMTRVCALVEGASPEALEAPVPACPDWRVRDLLAHVVGVGRDAVAGEEPDDHPEDWTQGHVDARASMSVDEVVAEWRAAADDIETYVRDVAPRPLADVTIHEQDLRGALDEPGARDTAALAWVRELMAGRLADALASRDLPGPVRLVSPGWTWQSADGSPGVVLEAPAYDLFRALTSRRSAAQLRSWVVDGDVGPYLDSFAVLGPLPDKDLTA